MDTIKNLRNDIENTLNTTLLNPDDIDESYQPYKIFCTNILKQIIGWLRPLKQWRDVCQDNLYRRNDASKLKERLANLAMWKREEIYDMAYYPTIYFKIPELEPNGDNSQERWFSTNLLDYIELTFSSRDFSQTLSRWRGNLESYDVCLRFINTFNADILFKNRPRLLSLDFKVIWFFFSKKCSLSQYHSSDKYEAGNHTLVFGSLTEEQMSNQLKYNREFIPDYEELFDADKGMRASSKEIVQFNYRSAQGYTINDDERIVRIVARTSPSGWYGVLLDYAIRVATRNLITPTGTKRKARIESTVDASARIKSLVARPFSLTRFSSFETEINRFIALRDCAPRVVEPVVSFWLNLRECLINGIDKNFLGEQSYVCFNAFQSADENGREFMHPRLSDFRGKPDDVDLFLSRVIKGIASDNGQFGITVYFEQLTMKYYDRTPNGDKLIGEVPFDYSNVWELNGSNSLKLHISFKVIVRLMRGDTMTEFSASCFGFEPSEDAPMLAFAHAVKVVRQISRWVDEWQDEDNEEGEKPSIHPFVDSESLCFEQYGSSLNASFVNGDIIGLLLHLKMWLTTYTIQSNPYIPITDFIKGATEENKLMLSHTREDGSLREYSKFRPERCSRLFYPSAENCVEMGCVYARIDEENESNVPSFRGNCCNHLKYMFSNMTEERKHDIFGTPLDKELVKRNKEELRKVEALIANKLTSEASQSTRGSSSPTLVFGSGATELSQSLSQENDNTNQMEE